MQRAVSTLGMTATMSVRDRHSSPTLHVSPWPALSPGGIIRVRVLYFFSPAVASSKADPQLVALPPCTLVAQAEAPRSRTHRAPRSRAYPQPYRPHLLPSRIPPQKRLR